MKPLALIPLLMICALASTSANAVEWRHGGNGHSDPADDETDDLELEITGPIEAIDSQTRTITVLGVSIIVSLVDGRKGAVDVFPALMAGHFVKASLSSITAPLTAGKVIVLGAYAQTYTIQGPLQSVDLAQKTIAVAGFSIGVSSSAFAGAEDRGAEVATLSLDNLSPGQNVEVQLESAALPALVAARVRIQNYTNQVDLDFHDKSGKIDQFNSDAVVRVSQTAKVRNPSGKFQKSEFRLERTTRQGTLSLAGLIPGRAKVEITLNGTTTKKTIKVSSNLKLTQKIKLKSER